MLSNPNRYGRSGCEHVGLCSAGTPGIGSRRSARTDGLALSEGNRLSVWVKRRSLDDMSHARIFHAFRTSPKIIHLAVIF